MTDPTRIYDDQHNNAPAVPQGWKLVPVEPTKEMIDAYCEANGRFQSARADWAAMLAATPSPAPAQEPAPTWSLREALQKAKDALSLALSDVDWRKDSPTQPVIHKAYNCAHQALALPTAEQVDDINVAESFTSAAPDMPPQLRKIHPLDFPLEVFLADLTTRPAKIIRAEMLSFTRTDGAYDIEPPLTVRHLCMFSRNEMRKWPQMGKKSLNEIEETLRDRGLHLWENHDERSLRLLREHKDYFK